MDQPRVLHARWDALTEDTFPKLELRFALSHTLEAARDDFIALTGHLTRIEAILAVWEEIEGLPETERETLGIGADQGAQWQFSRDILLAYLPGVVWFILEHYEKHPEEADEALEDKLLSCFSFLSRHPAIKRGHLPQRWITKMTETGLDLPKE